MAGTAASRPGDVPEVHQRAFFDAYGFVVLRGMFAAEVDEIGAAFDEIYDDPANPRLDLKMVGHRWGSRQAMAHFVEKHPRLTRLHDDGRVAAVADRLVGPDAVYVGSDAAVYCCETEWHFDSPDEPQYRHVKFALYLDRQRHDSGALRVLPLSHHDPGLYGGPLEGYLGYDGGTEARTGILGEHLPCWTLETEPGDVLAWDYRLMHSAFGTTEPRRKFALNFRSPVPLAGGLAGIAPAARPTERSPAGPLAGGPRPAPAPTVTPVPAGVGASAGSGPDPAPDPADDRSVLRSWIRRGPGWGLRTGSR